MILIFVAFLLAFAFSGLVTHAWSISDQTQGAGGSTVQSSGITETGSSELNVNTQIAASSTNHEIDISFTAAGLQSLMLLANQPVTVKTNSTGSPGNTWSLVAGRPLTWRKSDGYFTNPVSADVTKLFITTTAGTLFQAKILSA